MTNLLLLTIFVVFSCHEVISRDPPGYGFCPLPRYWNRHSIDVQKLRGLWYILEDAVNGFYQDDSLVTDLIERCDQVTITPKPAGDGWVAEATGLRESDGDFQQYSTIWNTNTSCCYPGVFDQFEISEAFSQGSSFERVWVLGSDYNKYLALYACRDDLASGRYYSTIQVLSRSPTLCDDDFFEVYKAIAFSGVATTLSSFPVYISQDSCPIFNPNFVPPVTGPILRGKSEEKPSTPKSGSAKRDILAAHYRELNNPKPAEPNQELPDAKEAQKSKRSPNNELKEPREKPGM